MILQTKLVCTTFWAQMPHYRCKIIAAAAYTKKRLDNSVVLVSAETVIIYNSMLRSSQGPISENVGGFSREKYMCVFRVMRRTTGPH